MFYYYFRDINIRLAIKRLSENPNVRPGGMVKIRKDDFLLENGIVLARQTKENRPDAKYFYLEPDDIELPKTFPKALPQPPLFRHTPKRSGFKADTPICKSLFNKWWKKAFKELDVEGVVYAEARSTAQSPPWRVAEPRTN